MDGKLVVNPVNIMTSFSSETSFTVVEKYRDLSLKGSLHTANYIISVASVQSQGNHVFTQKNRKVSGRHVVIASK